MNWAHEKGRSDYGRSCGFESCPYQSYFKVETTKKWKGEVRVKLLVVPFRFHILHQLTTLDMSWKLWASLGGYYLPFLAEGIGLCLWAIHLIIDGLVLAHSFIISKVSLSITQRSIELHRNPRLRCCLRLSSSSHPIFNRNHQIKQTITMIPCWVTTQVVSLT